MKQTNKYLAASFLLAAAFGSMLGITAWAQENGAAQSNNSADSALPHAAAPSKFGFIKLKSDWHNAHRRSSE
jgi:hypothetical protein